MSKWRSFAEGYTMGQRMVNDYQDASKKRDLAEVAKAQETDITQSTPATPEQLERAANETSALAQQDAAEFGLEKPMEYRPASGQSIQKTGVSFLGKEYDKPLSDQQRDSARQLAMAGVLEKHGDIDGSNRMRRDQKRDARDDDRYAWEKTRNERQLRLDKETDADKAVLADVDAKTGEWFKTRLTGPDGAQRDASVDDHLAASQFRASQLMGAGKTEAAGQVMKDFNAQSLVKIQLNTAQRNEDLGKTAGALANGDLDSVKNFYNQYVPDGAQVSSVKRGANGQITIERQRLDGTPMPPTVMKDTGQLLAAMTSFKDPMALYNWSQNEFKNNMAVRADNRAAAADGRAGVAFAQGQSDRGDAKTEKAAKAAAAVNLFKEKNPNASPAEIEAVRAGVLDAIQKEDSSAPAEVKLANAALNAGVPGVTDMASALKWARSNNEKSPDALRAEIYGRALTASMGNADAAEKATNKAMAYLSPAKPSAKPRTPPVAVPVKGEIRAGFEYVGGDPNSQKSWRPVSAGAVK